MLHRPCLRSVVTPQNSTGHVHFVSPEAPKAHLRWKPRLPLSPLTATPPEPSRLSAGSSGLMPRTASASIPPTRPMEETPAAYRTGSAPILRWAGSKRKLLPRIAAYVPACGKRYIEPFAGSACLFFHLSPRRALLGDINRDLIQAYQVVRNRPTAVAAALAEMPPTEAFYYFLRAQLPQHLRPVEQAARFIYLNRFCFNGVFRTNKNGAFNVPRGTRTGAMPTADAIRHASRALRNATLVAGDFENCLRSIAPGDFVYLDPPYAKRERPGFGEYGYNVFAEADLDRLISSLRMIESCGATFLLSYSYSRRTRDMFKSWRTRTLLVRRHVAGFSQHRGYVREILVTNVESK